MDRQANRVQRELKQNHHNKSVVLFGWRCARFHMYAGFGDISSKREQTIIVTHISDTRTMCWEIYYVHPQSGRTLLLDWVCSFLTAHKHIRGYLVPCNG